MKFDPARARHFASDNWAGICPEAWAGLQEANAGHAAAYGNDRWTAEATRLIRELFATECEVFFVFNGTAANALSLAAATRSYHSVLCHELAHVEEDECGAPAFFAPGTKLLPLPGAQGRLAPATVEAAITRRDDVHHSKPRVLTLTQATEMGTVYQPAEIAELAGVAHRHGLIVHLDGARLANAVASLDTTPAALTWQAGIDVVSLGGAKNGLAMGEAIVFFRPDLAAEFAFRRKQSGQLASKMRFLTSPWAAMLRDGAWLRHARHANAMAARLAAGLAAVPGVRLLFPRQANSVFAALRPDLADALRDRGWGFYDFPGTDGQRLMCAWDTTTDDVDGLLADLKAAAARGA